MKFLLKILVFVLLILISKYARENEMAAVAMEPETKSENEYFSDLESIVQQKRAESNEPFKAMKQN